MYEVILKRFEHPDEVRTFEKGGSRWFMLGNDDWTRDLPAGLEVVAACGEGCGCEELHGGACRHGRFGRATAAMDDAGLWR